MRDFFASSISYFVRILCLFKRLFDLCRRNRRGWLGTLCLLFVFSFSPLPPPPPLPKPKTKDCLALRSPSSALPGSLSGRRRRTSWSSLQERSKTKMLNTKSLLLLLTTRAADFQSILKNLLQVLWEVVMDTQQKLTLKQSFLWDKMRWYWKCKEMQRFVEHCWWFWVLDATVWVWKKWDLRFGKVWKKYGIFFSIVAANPVRP